MSKQRVCITFAGVVGSSKTPIATYLSWNLGIPIISNDALRTEVTEDLLKFDKTEYEKRRDERGKQLIASGKSFIYDASIDREWQKLQSWLAPENYRTFIISLDLSKLFLEKLYEAKQYTQSLARLDVLMSDHQNFVDTFGQYINVHITDAEFQDRLDVSLNALRNWLDV